MRRWIRQFLAIAALAATEAVRQPVFLLVATTCMVLTSLMPILLTHTLGEAGKLVRDSSLALQFVGGLVLGSYAACASLTREIRRGTAAAVLSKPVGREVFFLAKFTGLAAVMIVFSAAATVAAMMSTRMASSSFFFDWWSGGPLLAVAPVAYALAGLVNFFARRPFVSTAFGFLLVVLTVAFLFAATVDAQGHRTAFGEAMPWNIVPAGTLVAAAIVVLTGLALTLAIRLDVVPTLALCSAVFALGLVSDYLFGRTSSGSWVAAFLYRIIPNWQHFWAIDALSGGGTIPWRYVLYVLGYAASYLVAILSLGMFAFRRVEVRV